VPSTRRVAEPGTIDAFAEDLRAVREAGGIFRAGTASFAAVSAYLSPHLAQPDEDTLVTARNLTATHTRRTCLTVREHSHADAWGQAASESVRTILLRPADDDRKVSSIRRVVQAAHDCHLSLDGLRKREDVVLRAIAEAVHADLVAAREQQGPVTWPWPRQASMPVIRVGPRGLALDAIAPPAGATSQ
jgi:hypothetical protein